jgi:hypothetical protein
MIILYIKNVMPPLFIIISYCYKKYKRMHHRFPSKKKRFPSKKPRAKNVRPNFNQRLFKGVRQRYR